ncbi:hypothetical protein PIB30_045398 [Stylosanthes scabra]|uniref:Uncharacterized protein n=1 Tax=Stylosanthes scabra TaxID=79078 RepID=A0ABU6WH97_9FABA|nr:hypothetical protein [Stylosanthes scabra]
MASLNPNDVAIKIKTMLEEAKPRFTDECCIYRVSREIRKSNEDAYTPNVVSIGPFHHDDQYLLKMEDQKRIYCREFIESSETKNLESFLSCVQELEPKIRGCYSEDIKLSKEELVMIILVDSCFLLQFLLKSWIGWTPSDDILLPPNLREPIHYDLLLIENQVPFFVLDELYDLAFPSTLYSGYDESHPPLLGLTLLIVSYSIIVPDITITDDMLAPFLNNVGRIAHFTDLSRKFLLTFSRLLQPVPSIRVTAYTEAVLRNLIIFEQCHCMNESYLADYIIALDFLIDTDKDVDLLIKRGIIENWLGDSSEVAKMFNSIGVQVLNPDFNVQYIRIFKELNAFCMHPCNKKAATLRRDYCNTPWKTVASIAGIFLLVLTVIQTVFSILQVVH